MSLTELVAEALALPPHARAYLAETLLESLDYEEDFSINSAWMREIEQRCQQLDASTVVTLPADLVFSNLRTQFDQ